jgi:hypothetical protein
MAGRRCSSIIEGKRERGKRVQLARKNENVYLVLGWVGSRETRR